MMFLCIVFISPLYFMIRKNWGGFVVNAILYGLALLCLLSLLGAWLAPLFWILGVGHAGWYLRKEMAEEQAEMLAAKMAEKMRQ